MLRTVPNLRPNNWVKRFQGWGAAENVNNASDMNGNTSYIAQWMTQIRRGWLETCILNLLAGEDIHGYGLLLRLRHIPGLGISEGSLYPLLSRLRLQGLIVVRRLEESPDGPPRKVYGLTPRGRQVLALMNRHFDVMTRQHQLAQNWSAP